MAKKSKPTAALEEHGGSAQEVEPTSGLSPIAEANNSQAESPISIPSPDQEHAVAPVDETVSEEDQIGELNASTLPGIITLNKALREAYAQIDEDLQSDGLPSRRFFTGLADVDALTAGFGDQELVVVAGRPGGGKSAFLNAVILNGTTSGDKRPMFVVSLEQPATELAAALLTATSQVDNHRLRKRITLTSDDMDKLVEGGGELKNASLVIDETPRQEVDRIAATAATLKAQLDICVVIVDALHLIAPGRRYESRHEEVGHVVRELKNLARSIRTPVVVFVNVTRQAEDRKARLTDLRESSSLEEIADVVLLLSVKDHPDPYSSSHQMLVETLKRRGGPIGCATLDFVKKSGVVTDEYARMKAPR